MNNIKQTSINLDSVKLILRERLEVVNEDAFNKYFEVITRRAPESVYSEAHHILPKKLFPEYKSFKQHPWNLVRLTYKDHILAHYYFSKATDTLWRAVYMMSKRKVCSEDEFLLNLVTLPDKVKLKHSDQTKQLLSLIGMGHAVSHDTRLKISTANKRRVVSEETRQRLSQSLKGREVTQETRDKISKAQIGKFVSEETRKKLSIAHTGKVLSETTRNKLSISRKGIKFSDERKARIGAANKGKVRTAEQNKANALRNRKGLKWQYYDELFLIWKGLGQPKYGKFTKAVVSMGYPKESYDTMVRYFNKAV